MSGLAAGIRLAHFGKDVIILDRHNAAGGLNSFYSFDGRKFDVGLHAVTNFVPPGVKGTPLVKLFRQLRIDREEFDLSEQNGSRIAFPGTDLRFTNDFGVLLSEVEREFPRQIDGFVRLAETIDGFDAFSLHGGPVSTRETMRDFITDPLLVDMILCPLMYYGSAWENDMDFAQFAIMFKSIFREGFARPYAGVRQIIRVLLTKYRKLGGKRRMKCGVRRLIVERGRVRAAEIDDGTVISADHFLSSAGLPETMGLCDLAGNATPAPDIGRLTFVETINILDCQPRELGWEETIVFFNSGERFIYERPQELVDPRSGVLCFPNNYQYGSDRELDEGVFRITAMANFDGWAEMPEGRYREEKTLWHRRLLEQSLHFLPPVPVDDIVERTRYVDMFTPRTVKKYTGHLAGAIYGSPTKHRDGRTALSNLYLCGTDQGFLGIIGAMLSGISMANLHLLSKG
jgi:phytoene dehydrogenase-like protein